MKFSRITREHAVRTSPSPLSVSSPYSVSRVVRLAGVVPTAMIAVGCRQEILSDLTEREAAKITNELQLRGIDAATKDQGKQRYTISVVKGDAGEAARIAGLIKPLVATRAEPEKPPGILSGPDQERLYVTRQLSRQLEESLQLLPAVIAARVTIAFPPKPPLDQQRIKIAEPGSASVLIITSPGSTLSTDALSHFISNGTTIPAERINIIISELPGVSTVMKEALPTPVTESAAVNVTLPLSISEEAPPNEQRTRQRDDAPAAALPLFFPNIIPISAIGACLLSIFGVSIPLFLRLRARNLRLAFRNLV